jgi:hypothetical protein
MKSKDYKENSLKMLLYVIICIIVFAIVVPVLYQLCIVGNNVYSSWDDTVWGGFLGSLWGGSIGGIGTLIAVYFTTNETRKIQKDSMNERYIDKQEKERRDRKSYTDGIIEYVAKYVTNINKEFVDSRAVWALNGEISNFDKRIDEKQKIIKALNLEMGNYELDPAELIKKDSILKNTILDKEDLENIKSYFEKERQKKLINRTMSNECYFILSMKLKDVTNSDDLINQLDYINDNIFGRNDQKKEWIKNETTKLMNIATVFVDKYINND